MTETVPQLNVPLRIPNTFLPMSSPNGKAEKMDVDRQKSPDRRSKSYVVSFMIADLTGLLSQIPRPFSRNTSHSAFSSFSLPRQGEGQGAAS